MEKILEYVLALVNHNLFTAMVGGGIVEQVIVPIPSPIISMAGGASLFGLHTSFLPSLITVITKVALPYAIGATLGTAVIFYIFYYGGHPILDKYGKYVGISKKLVVKIQ
jgi:membrane protein DedA with SNARE-associated domain